MTKPGSSKRELLSAYKDAVSAHREDERLAEAEARRRKQRTPYFIEVMIAIALIAGVVFVTHREWFLGPTITPPSAIVAEANTRSAMYVTAMQLHQFKQRTATYPESIKALPVPSPAWLSYRRDQVGGFVLQAQDPNGKTLTLTSADDPKAFLGDSFLRLKERGQ